MKKKILVIEDDLIFANVYRNKLVLDGFEVEIANDGESGLEMVRSFQPDAIILDLILPKLPGVEVIKRLRQEAVFQHLPVIVFTNTYLTSTVQEAWKAGATKCLAKASCTPNQVIGTLVSVLSGAANGAASKAAVPGHAPTTMPRSVTQPSVSAKNSATADDAAFQAELRKTFIESWSATLSGIRTQLQAIIKAENEIARLDAFQELYRRVHALTGSASITGLSQIAQMADALEALLRELQDKPETINASTLRTVASAVDSLSVLFDHSTSPGKEMPPARVLVVDDEQISRRAITYALDKARLKSVSVEDPVHALKLVAESRFDLIFLDVGLPTMNGFELCTRIRGMSGYKKVPVVFITSLNDFESRANSTMSGGNDFIAKPFLFIELAVKALVYVLRGRMTQAKS